MPQPKAPVKSHFSETGGYTTPAPEYKQPAVPKTNTGIKPKVETIPVVKKLDSKVVAEKKNDEVWIIKLFKFLFK